ncbi:MAG TPA: type II toxin-antitoxin system RelE/ParE family toxin [Thermoanaerobaculia bacterium]|nr:type II toxin-antitoxin system RelE/ParE family toxin [Thermoanaerobaculia bacterium]
MSYSFLAPARSELEEAVGFYDSRQEGLGDEFAAEAQAAIARILHNPYAWPKVSEGVRRCRLRRFPYGLVYQVRPNGLLIVAVMHLRRNPFYWRDRVRPKG